jgi:hypothetical protein
MVVRSMIASGYSRRPNLHLQSLGNTNRLSLIVVLATSVWINTRLLPFVGSSLRTGSETTLTHAKFDSRSPVGGPLSSH